MNKPIISIIVPIYNVEQFLHCCIDSILAQTFTEWELLLIDDGSPDRSGEICDEYAAKDSRVRVFHKENGGVSNARNLGLDNARGEWVTFVDADDIIQPGFLRGLLAPTEEYEALDFVQAGCCNYRNEKIVGIEQQYELYVGNDPAYLFNHFRGLTSSKLFRLENVNHWSDGLPLRFDEKMKIAEDMAFTLDYLLTVKRYAFVSEVGYYYRIDNMYSATKSKSVVPYDNELHSFKHLFKSTDSFIKRNEITLDRCTERYSQRGKQLQNTLLSLYRNKTGRCSRISHIKEDFTCDEMHMLEFVKDNAIKKIVFSLLRVNVFIFDYIVYSLNKIGIIK